MNREDMTIKQRLAAHGYTVERVADGPRPFGVCITKDGQRVHDSMYATAELGLEIALAAEAEADRRAGQVDMFPEGEA